MQGFTQKQQVFELRITITNYIIFKAYWREAKPSDNNICSLQITILINI